MPAVSDKENHRQNSSGQGPERRDTLNFDGIVFSAVAMFIMGIYHPIVIKAEYHFSQRIWPLFAAIGLACLVISVQLSGLASYIVAFLGATNLWCIVELKQQGRRVARGWFPANPKRKAQKGRHL